MLKEELLKKKLLLSTAANRYFDYGLSKISRCRILLRLAVVRKAVSRPPLAVARSELRNT